MELIVSRNTHKTKQIEKQKVKLRTMKKNGDKKFLEKS